MTIRAARKRLVIRSRRRVMGGLIDIRVYADGSLRARCDHPSNDPEIECAMAGRVLRVAREVYRARGLAAPTALPMVWRDDP